MTRIAAPALVVMMAIATLVGVGAWNRSGEPSLTITLTERELQMPWSIGPAPGEDPGLQLRLVVEYRHEPLDARNWLPEARLREIGFPLDVPVGAPQAADKYDNVPPRLAWVVFEHDGAAWRDLDRRRALLASEAWRRGQLQSRLVPVDGGPDFESLRARYPSGHLILRAIVALTYLAPSNGGPLVHGVVREVLPHRLSVPARLRPVFEGVRARQGGEPLEPRYDVEIAVGRLRIPYVRAARLRE